MTYPDQVAGLPETGPATLDLVKAQLSTTDALDDTAINAIVTAVNQVVRRLPVAEVAVDQPDWSQAGHVVAGAVMLAARLHRRRNSPDGVAVMGDLGPLYVQRNDPDVAMLLELGAHARPAVG